MIYLKRDFEENKKDNLSKVLWKVSQPKHEYDDDLKTDVCSVDNLLKYIGKFIRCFEENSWKEEVIMSLKSCFIIEMKNIWI